jgi:membrane protease subunit (stomatin/prohibitin family)
MGVFDFIKGELLEVIEWTDDSRDTLSFRYPDEDKAIKNGAQLIVRESQLVQFVYLGEFGDTFGPGKHTLTTDNIPVLTRLKSWKYGFNSPFKADVYYLTTRLFTGNKWGTSNPIMLRDDDFGIVRARAFGTFDFKIVDAKLFLKEVAGSDQNFRLDEFADTMRSRIVSIFSDALASSKIPVLDVASRYTELGEALLPLINPVVSGKYGIQIGSFIVENVSVPPEVEQAIDKRSSMAAVGNLNDFVKYQMAKGMEAPGGGGPAGMASELAVGFAIAQQIMQQQGVPGAPGAAGATGAAVAAGAVGAAPDLLSPADVAKKLGVPEADVMTIISSGELAAKKDRHELSHHARGARQVPRFLGTDASHRSDEVRLDGACCFVLVLRPCPPSRLVLMATRSPPARSSPARPAVRRPSGARRSRS